LSGPFDSIAAFTLFVVLASGCGTERPSLANLFGGASRQKLEWNMLLLIKGIFCIKGEGDHK